MSVLIKGMEMPKTCRNCRLSTVIAFDKPPLCDALVEYMSYGDWEAKRLDNCPLVPVPKHGRLIDADAPIPLVDTHGKNIEVTVAHIIENNLGIVNAIIESEAFR